MGRSFLDRVRAPEFTGPNRCWPCTGLNLVLVALAETLSVAPEDVGIGTSGGRGVAVTVDGEWVGEWPSRTALVADAATERVLSDSAWTDLSRPDRADLAARIRGLAGHCPVCGECTRVSGETVESCCREADVVAVTCPTCGRLAEFEQSPAAFAAGR